MNFKDIPDQEPSVITGQLLLGKKNKLPDGLKLINSQEVIETRKLNQLIDDFSDWNKDLQRDRAFFGYQILEYSQPEAVVPVDNMDHEIPTELRKQISKLGIKFNHILLEKFTANQGVNPHTFLEVCGEYVYIYFHHQDCNLVFYQNPDPEEWQEHKEQRERMKKENTAEIEELSKEISDLILIENKTKEQKIKLRELRGKLSSLKPVPFPYFVFELLIPKGSIIKMNLNFRKNWKICLPKRKNIALPDFKKEEKDGNYTLFTVTFCEYDTKLIKEFIPRDN